MKRIATFAAATSLMLGGFAFMGCDRGSQLPPDESGNKAGGNGAFGESPDQPGQYQSPSAIPTTQPSQPNVDEQTD